ncbi:MAG TPA: FeoA family protein [bacterium]
MRAALSSLEPGTRAVVATLPPDAAVADELAALRVLPGEEIEVVQSLPFGGPLLIRGAGGLYAIGRGLAGQVGVET